MESKRTINVMFNGEMSIIRYFGNFDLNSFKETLKEQLKIDEPSKSIMILDEEDFPLMICEPVPNPITIKIRIDSSSKNFQPFQLFSNQYSSGKQNPFLSPSLSKANQPLPNQPLTNPIQKPIPNQNPFAIVSNSSNDKQGVSVNLSFSKPFQQSAIEIQKNIWDSMKLFGRNSNQSNTILSSKPLPVVPSSEKDSLGNPIVQNQILKNQFVPKGRFKPKIQIRESANRNLNILDQPPRKINPYIVFICQKRSEISKANPDKKGKELVMLFGEMWKNMDPDQKQIYERMAEEKYQEKLKKYYESKDENLLGQKRGRSLDDKDKQD